VWLDRQFNSEVRHLAPFRIELAENKLEIWMGLEINREKTSIVDMKQQKARLSFLGFTFQSHRSRFANKTYFNISPQKEALARARGKIRAITGTEMNFHPVPEVIKKLNRFLIGWGNYFYIGHPAKAFSTINYFVGWRLYRHLLRRSQKRKFNAGSASWYRFFKESGLVFLSKKLFKVELK